MANNMDIMAIVKDGTKIIAHIFYKKEEDLYYWSAGKPSDNKAQTGQSYRLFWNVVVDCLAYAERIATKTLSIYYPKTDEKKIIKS